MSSQLTSQAMMFALLGLAAALAGWYQPRLTAGTRLQLSMSLLLDLLIPLLGFVWLCALSARPLFAGFITLALGAGYAYADRAKRAVLAEPIVFTDVFQAFDIARHPKLALPFPHVGRVLGGVALVLAFFAGLFVWEPASWRWSPWQPLAITAALVCGVWLVVRPAHKLLGPALRALRPRGDAARDAIAFGPLATLLIHGLIARAEREARRVPPPRAPLRTARTRMPPAAPMVLVQCESFFDVRRMHSGMPANLLPNFDRLRSTSGQSGRLIVPCWGANTVRTEFEVLSGLSQTQVGMDWFDPYHRFADAPLASLAWRLRGEGYRTVCVHPFDRNFYRRDRVMQQLGFEIFLGEEAFAGAQRRNGYVADIEVARAASAILDEEGDRTFIFLITMENHGPWAQPAIGPGRDLGAAIGLPPVEEAAFGCYLEGLRSADAMLGLLAERLGNAHEPGLLGFYGDHLPGFPATFAKLDFADRRSDYLIWRAGTAPSRNNVDLPAHRLGQTLWEAFRGRASRPARVHAGSRRIGR